MRTVIAALAGLVLLVILIGGVSFLPPAQACPAIGPPVEDSPPGWTWEQDVYNGCAYTLFSEQGERAPDEVYDDLQIEPPNPALLYPPRLLGIVAIAVSIAGLVALITHTRRPRQSSNDPGFTDQLNERTGVVAKPKPISHETLGVHAGLFGEPRP